MTRLRSKLLWAGFLILSILFCFPVFLSAEGYIIGEGDTLSISVWGIERLNFAVKVRPDGVITVPSLGDVHAAGFEPKDLQKDLTEKLKKMVKNPIVSVTVTEITNSKIYIFGGGVKSGIFDLNRKTSLLQILCSLEDIKKADFGSAYLLRDGVQIKRDFYNLFINGDISEDIPVKSNDAIFIPGFRDKNIYVLGAVVTPKPIEYREGITVMEAILESGGFTKFANQNKMVIARTENGQTISIPVNATTLFKKADLSQNLKLKPGDYVLVKESFF